MILIEHVGRKANNTSSRCAVLFIELNKHKWVLWKGLDIFLFVITSTNNHLDIQAVSTNFTVKPWGSGSKQEISLDVN
jgi:hypothetical protein